MACIRNSRANAIKTDFRRHKLDLKSTTKRIVALEKISNRAKVLLYSNGQQMIGKYYNSRVPVHLELSWFYKNSNHAMALIIFPDKTVEFFDPSGFKNNPKYPPDKRLKLIFDGIKDKDGFTFVNMNEKNINYSSNCNEWSLYFHFLRHNTLHINSKDFIRKYISKWHQIANTKDESIKRMHIDTYYKPFGDIIASSSSVYDNLYNLSFVSDYKNLYNLSISKRKRSRTTRSTVRTRPSLTTRTKTRSIPLRTTRSTVRSIPLRTTRTKTSTRPKRLRI